MLQYKRKKDLLICIHGTLRKFQESSQSRFLVVIDYLLGFSVLFSQTTKASSRPSKPASSTTKTTASKAKTKPSSKASPADFGWGDDDAGWGAEEESGWGETDSWGQDEGKSVTLDKILLLKK